MRTAAKRLKAGRRRGASALEFALVLPLLITIVLGCVDFGRFAYTYIAVTNAARVGAGVASDNPVTTNTRPFWEALIKQAVVREMGAAFNAADIDTQIPFPPVAEGDGSKRVSVQVSYPFATIVAWPAIPSNLTLRRTVKMRTLYY